MRVIKKIIALSIFFVAISSYGLTQVSDYDTSLISALPGICPHKINCAPGTNFHSISSADYCGCCKCHGGAAGCAGGAKGRIICLDGTTSNNCSCQYSLTK